MGLLDKFFGGKKLPPVKKRTGPPANPTLASLQMADTEYLMSMLGTEGGPSASMGVRQITNPKTGLLNIEATDRGGVHGTYSPGYGLLKLHPNYLGKDFNGGRDDRSNSTGWLDQGHKSTLRHELRHAAGDRYVRQEGGQAFDGGEMTAYVYDYLTDPSNDESRKDMVSWMLYKKQFKTEDEVMAAVNDPDSKLRKRHASIQRDIARAYEKEQKGRR